MSKGKICKSETQNPKSETKSNEQNSNVEDGSPMDSLRRRQKAEGRRQKAEDRRQKAEDGRRKTEGISNVEQGISNVEVKG